jgi:hypothetical protein
MTDEKSPRYWKARAEALEAANQRLHERLFRLMAALPPEFLDLFDGETEGRAPRPRSGVLHPDEESPHLTPSDVESDLERLWERIAPPRGD